VAASRAAPLAALALLAAACGSTTAQRSPGLPTARGNVVRIAVARLPSAESLRPFRVVTAARGRLEARRGKLRLVFRKLEPHRALRLFRRGKLDEAPVPLGDIQAVLRDPVLRPAVRIRRLRAVDVVVCEPGGALDLLPELRRAYDETADRADYQALVPELEAPAAETLGERPEPSARAAALAAGRARKRIASLPRVAVRFARPEDPDLAYGAELLVAAWRDVGLGAYFAPGRADASFQRLFVSSVRQMGPPAQRMIPIAWVADARLVSPRLEGWHENALGVVDYSRLRFRGLSRSR